MSDNINTDTSNGINNTGDMVVGAGGVGKPHGYPSKADCFAYKKHELQIDMSALTTASNLPNGTGAIDPQTNNSNIDTGSKNDQGSQPSAQAPMDQVPGNKTIMKAWLECRDDERLYQLSDRGN